MQYNPKIVPSYNEFDAQVRTMLEDDSGAFIPITSLKERFDNYYHQEWDWKKDFWKGKGNALEYFNKRPDKFTVLTQENINIQISEWRDKQKRKHVDQRVSCQIDFIRLYDYNSQDHPGLVTLPDSFEKQLSNVMQGQCQTHIRIFAALFEAIYEKDLDEVAVELGYSHAEDMLINRIKIREIEVKRDNKRGWFIKCTRPMADMTIHNKKIEVQSNKYKIDEDEEAPDFQDVEEFPSLGGQMQKKNQNNKPIKDGSQFKVGPMTEINATDTIVNSHLDDISPYDSISNVGTFIPTSYPKGPPPQIHGSQVSHTQTARGPPPNLANTVGGRQGSAGQWLGGRAGQIRGPPPGMDTVPRGRGLPQNLPRTIGPMPNRPPNMNPQKIQVQQQQQLQQQAQQQQPYQQQQGQYPNTLQNPSSQGSADAYRQQVGYQSMNGQAGFRPAGVVGPPPPGVLQAGVQGPRGGLQDPRGESQDPRGGLQDPCRGAQGPRGGMQGPRGGIAGPPPRQFMVLQGDQNSQQQNSLQQSNSLQQQSSNNSQQLFIQRPPGFQGSCIGPPPGMMTRPRGQSLGPRGGTIGPPPPITGGQGLPQIVRPAGFGPIDQSMSSGVSSQQYQRDLSQQGEQLQQINNEFQNLKM